MSIPSELEIRDAAKRLGYADENGNYPSGLRNKLAAAVQAAQWENAEAEESVETTAVALARFDAELVDASLGAHTARAALVVAAAEWLMKTAGLQLKPAEPREENTP